MNISAPFIRRPIATSLLSLAILLAGSLAHEFLPVAALPQVEFPTISVSAGLPGASPETMASAVATPLERQFGRIAGITEMTSTSQLGSTNITLQFDLGRDINAASRDVQAAINAARGQLPANLPNNPFYRRSNPADAPILILALTSNELELSRIYDAADTILAQKIAQVEGVGQVSWWREAPSPSVRVQINPAALANRGLSLEDVRTALRDGQRQRAQGRAVRRRHGWVIRANDQLFKAEEYRPLVVAYRNGAPVRLGELGTVFDSVEDVRAAGLQDNEPAVIIIVFRQPGANVIATTDRIKALMPELQASVPPSIRIKIAADPTQTIRASVHDIQFTLPAHHRPRGARDLPVPAERLGHDHPEHRRAPEPRGHLRGHVPPRLQPRQLLADGLDRRHRLRGGRRDRGHREHHPPPGDGRASLPRRPSRARARWASPSSPCRSRWSRSSCPSCSWAGSWAGSSGSSRPP